MTTIQTRINYLESYRKQIGHVNPDIVPSLLGAVRLERSGLKTRLIHTLCDLSGSVTSQHYDSFRAVSRSFYDYIGDKITRINPDIQVEASDPWKSAYYITPDIELLNASEHYQDILFVIQLLSSEKFEEGIENTIKDIDHFLDSLEVYEKLFTKRSDVSPTLCEEIRNRLKVVRQMLGNDQVDYDGISSLMADVDTRIKSAAKVISKG